MVFMKIGLVFPQTEFGNDPLSIRDYAQSAEELGFNHILAYDHVLGAHPDRARPLNGPYTDKDPFHEVFVLFSYMAALTSRIEFTTGILILPQRETALVAKQAAALDVLSGGRLRLGVGIGWNWVEYEALNQDFHRRGKRVEEQVELLQKLWTMPLVTFEGNWHHIDNAGLNPMPIQQPIPIWFGGSADPVLRRIANMGEGWLTNFKLAANARPSMERISAYAEEYGRDPASIGLEPRLLYGKGDQEVWSARIKEWADLGATHLSLNTMYSGFNSPEEHLKAVETFASFLGG
jgi:probable F420-dependent oxidoreductase